MPYSDRPRQPRQDRRDHQPRRQGQGGRAPRQGGRAPQGHPQGRQLRGRRDTGYALRSHNINFRDRRGGSGPDRRLLILAAAAVLVLVLLVVLVSSCVRGCSAGGGDTVEADQASQRVAPGVSGELSDELNLALDDADKLEQIAQNADDYASEEIVELALREPAAIDFVSRVPSADKTSQSYDDALTKGTVPELYDWDSRWGFVDYAGLPLGVSGSGPTCLAMAYMGLTGSADRTPADMAALATEAGQDTGDAHTAPEFFSAQAEGLGLYCETPEVSAGEIVGSLQNSHPVICLVRADTLTPEAHYVICASLNEDQTVNVFDPTSSTVATRPWSAATIASYSDSVFVFHLADDGGSTDSGDGSDASGEDGSAEQGGDEGDATE